MGARASLRFTKFLFRGGRLITRYWCLRNLRRLPEIPAIDPWLDGLWKIASPFFLLWLMPRSQSARNIAEL